jgi:hypothetical protein
MLDGIKRWLAGNPAQARRSEARATLEAFAGWSRSSQVQIRTPREGDGVIIDGKSDGVPWRLEWGPSQRPYVLGQELRIRAELPLAHDLQAIVLNRVLQEAIEKAMFEQFVEGVQTRIDTETPAEMRWVVMYPKLNRAELGDLHDRYAAAASLKPWLQHWLAGPLSVALVGLKSDPATAFVLMVNRGKVTLRTEVDEASPRSFEPHLRLFEAALREARRAKADADADADGDSGAA